MKKKSKMYQERWQWGMTTTAEVWNGRLAMLGFIALLIELISGRGLLHFVGFCDGTCLPKSGNELKPNDERFPTANNYSNA